MKPIRYTDGHKYPNGYRKEAETDIGRTFARVRAEQRKAAEESAMNEQERQAKVRRMAK